VIATDTSVLVAAYATWHDAHQIAADALRRRPLLIGHAALETYSVLTRLPEPLRVPPRLALEYLERNFPAEGLALTFSQQRELLGRVGELGIAGGAVYDALIAETARAHDTSLLSLDRRAAVVYERLGVAYELIG